MASYIPVPRDLSKVKSKILFNLTKRQLICFSIGALVGFPVFFLIKMSGNISMASLGMIFVMLPFFFLAMYEKHGEPLEVILKHVIETKFLRPKVRIYETNNYYDVLIRQHQLKKEVDSIVSKKKRKAQTKESATAFNEKRTKTHQKADPKGKE